MEPRLIIQFRISKRWTRGSQEPAHMLAQYLYDLYTFTGLADPSASWGWSIGNDTQTGVPYLFIFENPSALLGSGDSGDLGDLSQEDLDLDLGADDGEGNPLGEEDLDPDL